MGCVSSVPKNTQMQTLSSKTPIKHMLATKDYPKQQWALPAKSPLELNPSSYMPLMAQKNQTMNGQWHHGPRPISSMTQLEPEPEWKEPIVISEEYLEEYVKLETGIRDLERQKVLQRLHVAVDQLQNGAMEITGLEETKQQIDTELKSMNMGKGPNAEVTGRQLIDEIDAIDGVKKATPEPGPKGPGKMATSNIQSKDVTMEVKISLEKKKEMIQEKLEAKRKNYEKLENEVGELNIRAAELLDMYLMQDELIVKIFGHGFSTNEEARLSNSLNTLEDKKARIEQARRKWKEAQLLLEYACKQLAIAVQQWQGLPAIPSINLEVRYVMSDEVNKGFKAGEKLSIVGHGAGTDSGHLPYCTKDELAVLEAMTASSRPVDPHNLMSNGDHSDTHKRACAMLKWFDRVLNTTIHRDLVDVSEDVRLTSQALRKERIGILTEKMKEKYGRGVSFTDEDFDDDEAVISKMRSHLNEGQSPQVRPYPHGHAKNIENGIGKLQMTSGNPKAPIVINDAKEGLDDKSKPAQGVLTDLKSEHERDMAKLLMGERENRAKVQKSVDNQLNARREIRDRVGRSPNRILPSV